MAGFYTRFAGNILSARRVAEPSPPPQLDLPLLKHHRVKEPLEYSCMKYLIFIMFDFVFKWLTFDKSLTTDILCRSIKSSAWSVTGRMVFFTQAAMLLLVKQFLAPPYLWSPVKICISWRDSAEEEWYTAAASFGGDSSITGMLDNLAAGWLLWIKVPVVKEKKSTLRLLVLLWCFLVLLGALWAIEQNIDQPYSINWAGNYRRLMERGVGMKGWGRGLIMRLTPS